MIARLSLSHQRLFPRAWTSWTLFCTAFHLSTQLAFNKSSEQQLGLSCTSNIVHLHCLPMNFSNNCIGSLSNGVYGLNLPPWPSKPCTLVIHRISLTSCNTTTTTTTTTTTVWQRLTARCTVVMSWWVAWCVNRSDRRWRSLRLIHHIIGSYQHAHTVTIIYILTSHRTLPAQHTYTALFFTIPSGLLLTKKSRIFQDDGNSRFFFVAGPSAGLEWKKEVPIWNLVPSFT